MDIRRFVIKTLLFASPLFLLIAVYGVLDVFKVLRYHDPYYVNGRPMGVVLNAGHVATMIFDHNRGEQKYDSFIFGSSRSRTYEVADWKRHIGAEASCFHFDGNAEPLYGVWCKVKYIDRCGVNINNALFVVDGLLLSELTSRTGHLYRIPPMVEENGSYVGYHSTFIKSFLHPEFLVAYFDYLISGEVKPYMTTDFLLSGQYRTHEMLTNEARHEHRDSLIAIGQYYTPEVMALFENRQCPDSVAPIVVGEGQRAMLQDIADVFKRHNTCYRVVVSPLYDQIKMNPEDVKALGEIFGAENVFDFSGVSEFTSDYRNYYDDSHYRPNVTREVLNIAYGKKQETLQDIDE